MRKSATISFGNVSDYAKVSERLKLFREDCPKGLIETEPVIDGEYLTFKAHIVKDKSDPSSAEATGHAYGKNTGTKAFEKLETIAVGRALALLGYLASGEIASSDEMEEFYIYRQQKIDEAIERLEACKSIEELKETFLSLDSLMAEARVIEAKDKRKAQLNEAA